MIINCCKGRKGYTLLELMLAMGLFVSLAGSLGYAIIRGVRAHNFESSYREATLQTRNVLNQMLEELRTADIPEDSSALSMNNKAIPSPVWMPNAYGTAGKLSDTTFFKEGVAELSVGGKGRKPHISFNRLVFTRKDPESGAYVFVDWFVNKNRRNCIYRVVHKLSKLNVCYTYNNDRYDLVQTVFGDGGLNFGTNLSDAYASGGTSALKVEDCLVAQLPGNSDRFSFAVEHDPNTNGFSGADSAMSDGVADRNGARYNPNLFRVIIKATIFDAQSGSTKYGDSNELESADDENPYATFTDGNSKMGNPHKRVVVFNEQTYTKH